MVLLVWACFESMLSHSVQVVWLVRYHPHVGLNAYREDELIG